MAVAARRLPCAIIRKLIRNPHGEIMFDVCQVPPVFGQRADRLVVHQQLADVLNFEIVRIGGLKFDNAAADSVSHDHFQRNLQQFLLILELFDQALLHRIKAAKPHFMIEDKIAVSIAVH